MNRRVLFVSNGYSEDMMAAAIAFQLSRDTGLAVEGLPLVGPGAPYRVVGVDVCGPCREMPPGAGFSWRDRNAGGICKDVESGVLSLLLRQIAHIRRATRDGKTAVVAVGDAFALQIALFGKARPVFVDTPISAYIRRHRLLERLVLRRAAMVFTRDEPTAAELNGAGIRAAFVGSPMLDCLETAGLEFDLSGEACIALLPGSRVEAYDNLPDLLAIAAAMAGRWDGQGLDFLLAAAPTLDMGKLGGILSACGWDCRPSERDEGIVMQASAGRARLFVVRKAFGDLLRAVDLVVGQAGTACEQAAGLGKPLLAFPGRGPQVRERFLRTQKRLLGEAMLLLPADREAVAEAALELLRDRERLQAMSRAGVERMGGGGGVAAIAAWLSLELRDARPEKTGREGEAWN